MRLFGHATVIVGAGLLLAPLWLMRAVLSPVVELLIRVTDALADVLSERLRA